MENQHQLSDPRSLGSMSHMMKQDSSLSKNAIYHGFEIIHWLKTFTLIKMMSDWFYSIYCVIFAVPLFYLWAKGPSFAGYGFWGGKSYAEICSHITSVDVDFWRQSVDNMIKCEGIINDKWDVFLTGCTSILYFMFFTFVMLSIFRAFLQVTKTFLSQARSYCNLKNLISSLSSSSKNESPSKKKQQSHKRNMSQNDI